MKVVDLISILQAVVYEHPEAVLADAQIEDEDGNVYEISRDVRFYPGESGKYGPYVLISAE